jgi:8-hydroxy-5-deazaflavin:NADPH oxidoreductase
MKRRMKVGVLGTGPVGQTLAAKLADQGHAVFVGANDPAATLARTSPDSFGNPPFNRWREGHPAIGFGSLAEAAAHGDLLVNATRGASSVAALKTAGEKNLAGKILVDVANPVDLSHGPSLAVCNTDSLAEQIQRAFPDVKVVKTLNTLSSRLMVAPAQLAGAEHTVFVSGNDAAAKGIVTELLQSFGWKDIVDLGDITTARGPEMMLPIVVRVAGTMAPRLFSFKLVR